MYYILTTCFNGKIIMFEAEEEITPESLKRNRYVKAKNGMVVNFEYIVDFKQVNKEIYEGGLILIQEELERGWRGKRI